MRNDNDRVLSDGRGGFVAVAIFGLIIVSAGMGAYLAGGASTAKSYPRYFVPSQSQILSNSNNWHGYRRPCIKMVGREDPELCAQWQAADTAERAAVWTFLQTLLSTLALLGLFVTLWYNRLTVSIADDTQREGQRIGQSGVRCYLDIRRVCLSLSSDGVPSVSLRIRNDGVSPARDVSVKTAVKFSILADDYNKTYKAGFPRKIEMLGVGRTLKMKKHPSDSGITKELEIAIADPDKMVAWWAMVEVQYTDVFGYNEKFSRAFAGRGGITRDVDMPTYRTDEMNAILRAEIIRRQHLGTWTGEIPD